MAFDINEARAIVEEAKKRGLIRGANAPDSTTPQQAATGPKTEEDDIGHLPDWLQKGIREPEPSKE
jgi:hypothetical protein